MATDSRGDYDARVTKAILNEAAAVIREFGFAGKHVILIGGLVPGLLVPVLDPGIEPHVGSRDIDLCLSAALVAGEVGDYERVEKSLRNAGFEMVRKPDGTRESWRWTGGREQKVTIEFFCPASADAPAGRLFRPGGLVGGKLCALALDAGRLLDEDNVERTVTANTSDGPVGISLRVTGLAAYVATKVDAIAGRSKNKDAMTWCGYSTRGLAAQMEPLRKCARVPFGREPSFRARSTGSSVSSPAWMTQDRVSTHASSREKIRTAMPGMPRIDFSAGRALLPAHPEAMRARGVEDLEILAAALAERRLEAGHELPSFGDPPQPLEHFHRPRGEDDDVRLARDSLMPVDRPQAAQRDGDPLFDALDLIETPHPGARDLEREEVLHERHLIDALGREVANAEQAAWSGGTSPFAVSEYCP